jgi:hypothetical protein
MAHCIVEDPVVSLIPYGPGNEDDQRIKAFPMLFVNSFATIQPPV